MRKTLLYPIKKFMFWRRIMQGCVLLGFYLMSALIAQQSPDKSQSAAMIAVTIGAVLAGGSSAWVIYLKHQAAKVYGNKQIYLPPDSYSIGRALRLGLWCTALFLTGFQPQYGLNGYSLALMAAVLSAIFVTIQLRLDGPSAPSYKQEQMLYKEELLRELTGKAVTLHQADELRAPAPAEVHNTLAQPVPQPPVLTPEALEPALAKLLEKTLAEDSRRNLRQEILLLVVGVILAFIVNWSSAPALEGLRRLFN